MTICPFRWTSLISEILSRNILIKHIVLVLINYFKLDVNGFIDEEEEDIGPRIKKSIFFIYLFIYS